MSWLKSYSEDIAEALELVDLMAETGHSFDLEWKGKGREYEFTAEVSFRRGIATVGHGVADTWPLAICKAFLLAMMEERE